MSAGVENPEALIRSISRRFPRWHRGDLLGEGYIGYRKALARHRPQDGAPVGAFAALMIRWEMQMYLASWGHRYSVAGAWTLPVSVPYHDRDSAAPSPEALLILREERRRRRAALRRSVAKLRPRLRRVIVEGFYREVPDAELAQRFQVNPNALQQLRWRAIRRLRVLMAKESVC